MDEEQIKDVLRQSSKEFRWLEEKHRSYEKRLEELAELTFTTPEQEREKSELKKLKLQVKDKMQAMILNYRKTH